MTSDPTPRAHRRERRTRPWVRFSERAARTLITVGGIGTIAAVTMICVFLVWVVVPLLSSGEIEASGTVTLDDAAGRPLHFAIDEYQLLSATLYEDGRVLVHRLENGALVDEQRPLPAGERLAAFASHGSLGEVAVGLADGSVRQGRFGFRSSFPTDVPAEFASLEPGTSTPWRGGILARLPEGQLRLQTFEFSLQDPVAAAEDERILDLDRAGEGADARLLLLLPGGRLRLVQTREKTDFLTGETVQQVTSGEFDLASDPRLPATRTPIEACLLAGGDNALVIWEDGSFARIETRRPDGLRLLEVGDLVQHPDARVTATALMIGNSTLVVGDSGGVVRGWFTTRPVDAESSDGQSLTPVHEIALAPSPVVALAPSPRTRLLVAGHEDGTIDVLQLTAATELASARMHDFGGLHALCVSPKEDGVFALTDRGVARFALSPGHPEATLATLFLPVWYEGYVEPTQAWQSSGGSDAFEPKLGLTPLVFGTLKGTLYSMLFGAPLALLAAIYTSEFLDRRLRSPVKSTIEMMASLPSVVLGFLAALFVAPLLQHVVPETIACFFAIPFCLFLGSAIWQLLPSRSYVRLQGWPRLLFVALMIPAGLVLAAGVGGLPGLGRLMEEGLFAGDIFLWLDGQQGEARGGWFLVTLPLSALLAAVASNRLLGPLLRRRWIDSSRRAVAVRELVRFAVVTLVAIAFAWVLASLLGSVSDPRGAFLGTYVQRNAMIVGFAMGFAIIPIIYTLSEDALSSVPEHLRLASLGSGATPWQTAVRVIVPTAASGLFSALMIGLGRAVGETMIVLMATGNTAITDWNIFNGFRTLSANLATELPEATVGSTHYRTLFLAALVLFALTFVLNTVAEIVRQRFRRRAYEL